MLVLLAVVVGGGEFAQIVDHAVPRHAARLASVMLCLMWSIRFSP